MMPYASCASLRRQRSRSNGDATPANIGDIAERGLRTGDVGTVVERHGVQGAAEEVYSVEFFDMTGNTVAVVIVPASAIRPPTPADRPAVRALSA